MIRMKKVVKGFNLIELMVVVAIIAILAVIAIPSYMNYVYRARVAEGLVNADPLKMAVSEYMMTNNAAPTPAQIGYPTGIVPRAGESNVASITQNANQITVNFVAGKVPNTANSGASASLILEATSGTNTNNPITWSCMSDTIAQNILPSGCQFVAS